MSEVERQRSRFRVKDACRQNLLHYTIAAFDALPDIEDPVVLDLGCGTGASSLCLVEGCDASVFAVDSDRDSLDWFRQKIATGGHRGRIRLFQASVFDLPEFDREFDLIIAEGLLNLIGFERGLSIQLGLLKRPGYIILHDELKDDARKRDIFYEKDLRLLKSFTLDEQVWWNEYYFCLEQALATHDDTALFEPERKEIELYKQDPSLFRSVFYVLERH